MHNRFDRFVKRLVREAISAGGLLETDAEVSPDAQRIDVWFTPDRRRAGKVLAPLGLFGRMCRKACTLEPFHRTPTGDQVVDSVVKHRFFCRELARRKPRPPAPTQWVISSGRPSAALNGLAFRRSSLCKGIYDAPPLLRTRLVVVAELPRTPDTLMLRLMGAGTTLRRAIADARAMSPDAVEHRLALPILIRLRIEVPVDPAKQNRSDQEFLMSTRDIEKFMEDLQKKYEKEGRKIGEQEGIAQTLLAVYRARFGEPPAAVIAALKSTPDSSTLQRWAEVVATLSQPEVLASLRPPRRPPAPRRAASSRSPRAAPRRAAPARRAPAAG